MRNAILLAGFIIMSSGCAVVKTPTISGVNQEEGKIKMTYSYGLFQKPDVKWNDALISANTQCKQWGYQDAQQSVGPQTSCIQEDQKGNCISWQVDSLYDCKLSEEQQIALNEKKRKQLIAQQEENAKLEKRKQEFLSNLSHFEIIVDCEGQQGGQMIKNLLYGLYRTDVRISNKVEIFKNEVQRGFYKKDCSLRSDVLNKSDAMRILKNGDLLSQTETNAYYLAKLGDSSINPIYVGIEAH